MSAIKRKGRSFEQHFGKFLPSGVDFIKVRYIIKVMSRLFGIIAKKDVDVNFLLLREEVEEEKVIEKLKSGIGFGWYEMGKTKTLRIPVVKNFEPKEEKFWKFAETIHSKIVIFHIREKTVGELSEYNTHPFSEGNFMFAHMGTIENWKAVENLLELKWKKKIKGETDSERLFYLLLQNWDEKDPVNSVSKTVKQIESVSYYNSLNFLITNGDRLFAFKKGNFPLFYVRKKPGNELCCASKSTHLAIRSSALKVEEAVVISAETLSEENWKELRDGEVFIVDAALKEMREKI